MRIAAQFIISFALTGALIAPVVAQSPGISSISVKIDVPPEQLARELAGKNWLSYNGD